MDTEFLKTFGQIAGLALVTFLIIFRKVICKNIFPTLKKNDAYRLLCLIIGLISAVAIIGIVVWLESNHSTKKAVQAQAYKGIEVGRYIRDDKIISEQLPKDWAMTQHNLGNILREQGIRTYGTQLLAEAVRAYQNALQVHTREQRPQKWAVTQNNLGIVLKELDKLK